jgi:hypothetical protein
MPVNTMIEILPFFVLGALGIATLGVASGALRSALRAEKLGEVRIELLRDQQERLELLREERRVLTEELEFERRERLEAQRRVKQLMREHPHLELEREIQRLTEELELEREGRLHNHRERQHLSEELERERLARSQDRRDIERLERELRELEWLLEERQEPGKAPKNGLWGTLFRSNKP